MNELSSPLLGLREISVLKFNASGADRFTDTLAMEEPLEIRLDYALSASSGEPLTVTSAPPPNARRQKSVSITMRTPGADAELAIGFLFTEGLIQSPDDVLSAAHCGPTLEHLGHSNVIKVRLAHSEQILKKLGQLDRNFYTTSSCGVCGKSSISALKTANRFSDLRVPTDYPRMDRATLLRLPGILREAQSVFDRTGGLHASGLFTPDGSLLDLREDVGRHNALDKVIGAALMKRQLPLTDSVLLLSGRISFELVQKASMAGIHLVAGVGAPSSLAVELAKEMDITLVGFLREQSFNVYHGEARLK